MVALRFVAGQRAQLCHHGGVFDAFSDHAEPRIVREVDGRACGGGVLCIRPHAQHKELFDLGLLIDRPWRSPNDEHPVSKSSSESVQPCCSRLLSRTLARVLQRVRHGALGGLPALGVRLHAVAHQQFSAGRRLKAAGAQRSQVQHAQAAILNADGACTVQSGQGFIDALAR